MAQKCTYSERQADEIELLRKRVRQLEKHSNCGDCTLLTQLVGFNL
jgi:uncharacterized protein YejL (UPF0352 family)